MSKLKYRPPKVKPPIAFNFSTGVEALHQDGPRILLKVGVHPAVEKVMRENNQAVPDMIEGVALIDTGAFSSCIDEGIAQQLGLAVIDTSTVLSASHQVSVNVYSIGFETANREIVGNVVKAPGMNLAPQGIIMLLGRDILRLCSLSYNGKDGTYSVHI